MPVNSASSSSASMQSIMRRQQAEKGASAVSYTRQHLPSVNSVGEPPQSTLQMGERLVAYAASTQHDAMVSLALRPSGLERLEGLSQISPPAQVDLAPQQAGLTSEQMVCVLETVRRGPPAL